jgi:hypothetical protein
MPSADQDSSRFALRFQQFTALAWHFLRQLRTTVAFAESVAVVLLLTLLIPQQARPDVNVATWVTTLPGWLQGWGVLLFSWGLSRLLETPWFWAPVGLLALSSLVALADYAPPSRRRARAALADIEWQHPLAQRVERSVRLPANPEAYLDKLKASLRAQGFSIDESGAENKQRIISARRWAWAWWGVVVGYGSLILLCLAFFISRYSLKTERLALLPFESKTSRLFDGDFELYQTDLQHKQATILYSRREAPSPRILYWRLYQPAFLNDALILPVAMEPVLTVEARDKNGELRRLIPVQVDLAPASRLNLPIEAEDSPLYFLIPSASLAFQITPVSIFSEHHYNVQVRRGSETTPSENLMKKLGDTFEIEDITMTISLNYNLIYLARRDWALPIYGVTLPALFISLLLLLVRPPWQIWLIPEVKGRGGQLYGVAETFGRARLASQLLERLLAIDLAEAEEAES